MLSLGKQSIKTGLTLSSSPGPVLCLLSVYYIMMNFVLFYFQQSKRLQKRGKSLHWM